MSAEASVVRGYIDWIVSVPWSKRSKVKHDLKRAARMLDEDHFGLDEVKDRILEYLAVQKRVRKVKGPVLCLVGPPGVGKTSLGESMARSTNRKFVRMALGGVRDEAEIRGHRRTYIGSMPGKLIQKMSKAGVRNPLFLLDEIDKMGMDHRGDPASAMLEVLDPEQNHAFNDHYLEVDYDLSDVMFVCTSNTMNIPSPLLDRMEVIRIPGYTEDEKLNIAQRYLIPKQIKQNGLKEDEITLAEDAVLDIIRYYTREAGVRSWRGRWQKFVVKWSSILPLAISKGIPTSPPICWQTYWEFVNIILALRRRKTSWASHRLGVDLCWGRIIDHRNGGHSRAKGEQLKPVPWAMLCKNRFRLPSPWSALDRKILGCPGCLS